MSNDPRSLTRRPSRSPAAALLAVGLIALGSLGAWLTGALLITGQWPSQAAPTMSRLGSTAMSHPGVLVAACVLAALGLIMLLAALRPGRPAHLAILPDGIPGQTAVSRRDLAALIQRRVEQVDGVDTVRVSLTRSRADIRVRTLMDDGQLQPAVTQAAQEALERLRPAQTMRCRVRVRRAD
ncbi:alkaline shock response membrane anchor protein AmaP [Actinomyces bowdenii]|uniref:alkaline shock response membrane anchor protein AmaP n=1 Tax=Actinomyces bowdenii TaxID=131109 RepID=UPI00214BCA28|nr:alkaline shock response membrane anchor protein AmaP [Actinomyces bowdenii]MCR2053535.1 alkaline shock response membrane anchor protein AmaP [Actinomyces bowdenii]